MTTTGDTTITDPVSIRVFGAPAPDTLNDKAFIVLVAQPMDETSGRMLYLFIEAGGFVVGSSISYMMDASTVDMPPPPPLHRFIPLPRLLPLPLTPIPLPPIPAPYTPSP